MGLCTAVLKSIELATMFIFQSLEKNVLFTQKEDIHIKCPTFISKLDMIGSDITSFDTVFQFHKFNITCLQCINIMTLSVTVIQETAKVCWGRSRCTKIFVHGNVT